MRSAWMAQFITTTNIEVYTFDLLLMSLAD